LRRWWAGAGPGGQLQGVALARYVEVFRPWCCGSGCGALSTPSKSVIKLQLRISGASRCKDTV
jgi:hypothetical protein